jgi:fluoride ion exporter CrcB/FEX
MSAGAPHGHSAHSMKQLPLVGVGGAIGPVARYQVGIAIIRITRPAFPFNTLFVQTRSAYPPKDGTR